jgi:hypothetical protein
MSPFMKGLVFALEGAALAGAYTSSSRTHAFCWLQVGSF